MTLHLLVPEGIDDPRRPSGGNVYDSRLRAGLEALGWQVREHAVGTASLADVLARLPDGAVVLVDGLVASTTSVLVAESRRLRVAVLLHMPGSGPYEPAVLGAAHAVVTTSQWARRWVLDTVGVPAGQVHVAVPGVDPGVPASGSAGGTRLLTVGPIVPAKGYDDLLVALAGLRDLDWHSRWVGGLDLAPAYADTLRSRARELGVDDRIELTGPLTPEGLDAVRADSDLLVAPSRRESYGMALAEGLARGLPAVATDVGGHPEALGAADDGSLPGTLVPLDDPGALAAAVRSWLSDAGLRERWRRAAAERAARAGSWAGTADRVAGVLNRIAPTAVRTGEG